MLVDAVVVPASTTTGRDHNNNAAITTTTQAARAELAVECDYVREAASATRFKRMLSPYPEFTVPAVVPALSSSGVLTTEWAPGAALNPCEECASGPAVSGRPLSSGSAFQYYLPQPVLGRRAWTCRLHVAMHTRCCHVMARMRTAAVTYIVRHVSQAAMTCCAPRVTGAPLDRASDAMSPRERDRVGARLLWLSLSELCRFRFMQTDPNWSNFLYDAVTPHPRRARAEIAPRSR